MNSLLSPSQALSSPWLWVIKSGPDQGQALPVKPGIFGRRNGLNDTGVSRENLRIWQEHSHFFASALPLAAPVYKLWKITGWGSKLRRKWRLRGGKRLRIAQTTLQIMARPTDLRLIPPPESRKHSRNWVLFMIFPLFLLLGLSMYLRWRIWALLGILLAITLVWLWKRSRQTPVLERLWLAAAAAPGPASSSAKELRVYTQRRWRARILTIAGGENICFTGKYAPDAARWVVAQALLYGQGFLSLDNPPPWRGSDLGPADSKALRIRIVETNQALPATAGEVIICIASADPPAWAQRIVSVSKLPHPVSPQWFQSFLAALDLRPRALELCAPAKGSQLPTQVGTEIFGSTDAARIQANWEHPRSDLSNAQILQRRYILIPNLRRYMFHVLILSAGLYPQSTQLPR